MFDTDKVQELHDQVIALFRDAKLTVGEILVAYGNVGRTLGGAIEGYTSIPDVEDLEKEYYRKSTPGLALCLQGNEVISWYAKLEEAQNKNS